MFCHASKRSEGRVSFETSLEIISANFSSLLPVTGFAFQMDDLFAARE